MDNNYTNNEGNINDNNTPNTTSTTNIDQTNTDNQQFNPSHNNPVFRKHYFDFSFLSTFFLTKEILALMSLKLTSPEDIEKQSILLDRLLTDLLNLIKFIRLRNKLINDYKSDYFKYSKQNRHLRMMKLFVDEVTENNLKDELSSDIQNTKKSIHRLLDEYNILRRSSN